MELNSGNLRSQCEAVIAVLQGLMSSKGGTSAGGVTGGVTDLELANICQQSHMSLTGCNNWPTPKSVTKIQSSALWGLSKSNGISFRTSHIWPNPYTHSPGCERHGDGPRMSR